MRVTASSRALETLDFDDPVADQDVKVAGDPVTRAMDCGELCHQQQL